jgi:glutathione synthase
MNFVFLMDPLNTVIMDKDTSFILMLNAHQRGHAIYFVPDGGITRASEKIRFHATAVTPQQIPGRPFIPSTDDRVCKNVDEWSSGRDSAPIPPFAKICGGTTGVKLSGSIEHTPPPLSEDEVDIVFLRSDPPFDEQYLINTWLLDLLPARIPVINRPSGVRTVNEKIWTTQFTSIIPPTLVGRNRSDILDFLREHKNIVAKPTGGHGGQSVFHVQTGGPNTNVILETLTSHWQRDIIVQKYVPESARGDKRVLLLNGEPLGAVLRRHAEDDHRNNFFSGGKPLPADITKRDLEIINVLKPRLQSLGLYFVGIDIIGDYLIEVNVTSPTCLQEMNRLYNVRLDDRVMDFCEGLIARARSTIGTTL